MKTAEILTTKRSRTALLANFVVAIGWEANGGVLYGMRNKKALELI
jgi:hypothetical protein